MLLRELVKQLLETSPPRKIAEVELHGVADGSVRANMHAKQGAAIFASLGGAKANKDFFVKQLRWSQEEVTEGDKETWAKGSRNACHFPGVEAAGQV